MKHQFFFFVLLCSFSMYAMQPEQKNITKSQLASTFTEFNSYMKYHYPHAFNTKEFGSLIIGIRAMSIDEFENNKDKLVNMMEDLKTFDADSMFDQTKLS